MSESLSDLKEELANVLKERNDLAMRCEALTAELAEAEATIRYFQNVDSAS